MSNVSAFVQHDQHLKSQKSSSNTIFDSTVTEEIHKKKEQKCLTDKTGHYIF